MRHLVFDAPHAPQTVLLLGAHCDDIEIGCGGTLRQLVERHPTSRFIWVTFSSNPERAAETKSAAARLLEGAKEVVVRIEDFRGSYFPYDGGAIKDYFEGLKTFSPDLVFTHYRQDLHQDHRVINELTWNTFRDQTIFEYEIPKFDGDLGFPNVFVPLTRSQMKDKCTTLMECFPSQAKRSWFTSETFEAIARLRGIECNAPEGYAEGFFGRKIRIAI